MFWNEGGATPPITAEGHLPGAINIQLDDLDARAGELDPAAATVVFY